MKKFIALLLVAVMCLSLVACGGSAENSNNEPQTNNTVKDNQQSDESKNIEEILLGKYVVVDNCESMYISNGEYPKMVELIADGKATGDIPMQFADKVDGDFLTGTWKIAHDDRYDVDYLSVVWDNLTVWHAPIQDYKNYECWIGIESIDENILVDTYGFELYTKTE